MKLFSKEEINKERKDQIRELTLKNERLSSSLKKIIKIQNEVNVDADKLKKLKEYEVWCQDLQNKMSKELENLYAYKTLVNEKKDEYYILVTSFDTLQDKILDKKEELDKLLLQVALKKQILEKSYDVRLSR